MKDFHHCLKCGSTYTEPSSIHVCRYWKAGTALGPPSTKTYPRTQSTSSIYEKLKLVSSCETPNSKTNP